MSTNYYKRFRMERELFEPMPAPVLPSGYRWVAWSEAMLDLHAAVKFECFRGELDASIFPCLGDRDGCHRLMREIRRKPGFLPAATWLVADMEGRFVATIQGVVDSGPIGSIQNVGVVPGNRGVGVGVALVARSLLGFRESGIDRVALEVTAENGPAVQMYRKLGFRRVRTLFRAVETR